MLRAAVLLILPLAMLGCAPQPEAPPRDIYAVSSPYGRPPQPLPNVGPGPAMMPGLPPPALSAPAR